MNAKKEEQSGADKTPSDISEISEDIKKIAIKIVETQSYIAKLIDNISFYINEYKSSESSNDGLYRAEVLLSSASTKVEELLKLIQSPAGKVIVHKKTSLKMFELINQLVLIKETLSHV